MKKMLISKNIELSDYTDEHITSVDKKDIAIIGISSRIADAQNYDEFWEILKHGRDCMKKFSEERKQYINPLFLSMGAKQEELSYEDCLECAFLDHIARFDAAFFGISPMEASLMDPSQKLFLTVAYQAMEDAGYGGDALRGSKTGVYVGYSSDFGIDYKNYIQMVNPSLISLAMLGNIKSLIAGRIAYLLDLKGPSMLVDTACSSTLVAVHLACEAIRKGECDQAICGGVKVMILPKKTDKESEVRIEAEDGRARTFDDKSDGTGAGEGSGAVLLKPLYKAIQDKDSIYAIIKGSAVNQDGASVGVSAPNGKAQENVIKKAWKEAGIDPANISYVETHGTGTQLGDLIEVTSLNNAFRKYTKRKQFCYIGSTKTNIGHLDSAAGIAGLIKLVLALKNKELPPLIHFHTPNRKIAFPDSAVIVNDRLRKWETNGERICGISSFGLSGTNCHMVLQEWREEEPKSNEASEKEYLFVLSSKSQNGLRMLVKDYIAWLVKNQNSAMKDICYTVQAGRGHYKYRLALVAGSGKELLDKLMRIHSDFDSLNKHLLDQCYYGEYSVIANTQERKRTGEITLDEQERLNIEMRKLSVENGDSLDTLKKMASLYVKGADVPCQELFRGKGCHRIHLPGYHMEEKESWLDINEKKVMQNVRRGMRHPYLHSLCVCSIDRDIYETSFCPDIQWALKEHKVGEYYVLPGTAYIESMRAIAQIKWRKDASISLNDLVFFKPLSVKESETVILQTIVTEENEDIRFVFASKDRVSQKWITHVEGRASTVPEPKAEEMDITRITSRLHFHKEKLDYSGSEFVKVGGRWKNIDSFYSGEDEVVVKLKLPEQYQEDLEDFMLHPSLLDNAVNFLIQGIGEGRYLPFTYKKLNIYGKMPPVFYSYIRKKKVGKDTDTVTTDIDLVDEDRKVFVSIRDYIIKKVEDADMLTRKQQFFCQNWQAAKLPKERKERRKKKTLVLSSPYSKESSHKAYLKANYDVIEVMLGEGWCKESFNQYCIGCTEQDFERLVLELMGGQMEDIFVFTGYGVEDSVCEMEEFLRQKSYMLDSFFCLIKALAKNKWNNPVDITVLSRYGYQIREGESGSSLNEALSALAKVVSQESMHINCTCIDMDEKTQMQEVVSLLEKYELTQAGYRDGQLYIPVLKDADVDEKRGRARFSPMGVYIITGGAGGVGKVLMEHIIRNGGRNLLLVSRHATLTKEQTNTYQEQGISIECVQGNVADYEAMDKMLTYARKKFGKINGILHCAGNPGDGFLFRKEMQAFQKVLEPKVAGTWVLDRLTQEDELEFFAMTSSINSVTGGQGQGDYSCANAYLDSFAKCRNARGKRTFAIDWPLWNNTGMSARYDVDNTDNILEKMEPSQAGDYFDAVLMSSYPSVIVGNPKESSGIVQNGTLAVEDITRKEVPENAQTAGYGTVSIEGKELDRCTETEIKLGSMVADVLKLSRVNLYQNFKEMGMDSIIAVRLVRNINNELSDTVDVADIFTYVTIAELASYIDKKTKASQKRDAAHSLEEIMLLLASGEISMEEAEELKKYII